MDRACSGAVLIVGDGDFSLSLAFAERGNLKSNQIWSTSLESEETILKHQNAIENITALKKKGVKVSFEVDARELHSDTLFEDRKFSRIIFNFPHSGGKSNNKKNRALLNDFFSSTVQILEDEGQIMVTLCKGQGGTPADKPMREWHDSWQIVSMATNSSLILREVLPFNAEEYFCYNSTGFRSQDKSFNTEGALTHVFELADSVNMPSMVNTASIKLDGKMYSCSSYLRNKLNRNLLVDKTHPITQVLSRILDDLSERLGFVLSHSVSPPWVHVTNSILTSEATPLSSDHQAFMLKEVHAKKEEKEVDTQLNEGVDENKDFDSEKMMIDDHDMNSNNATDHTLSKNKPNYLVVRKSLLEQLRDVEDLALKDQKCLVRSGLVARPCFINSAVLPVQHEVLLVCPKTLVSSFNFDKFCETVCNSIKNVSQSENIIITDATDISDTEKASNLCPKKILEWAENGLTKTIGTVYSSANSFVLLISLDRFTQIVFQILNPRLLWSEDNRISRQFESQTEWPVKFEPFNLYPMKINHDLSLWEKEGEEFDESEMCHIVRNIIGDVVDSVELLDRYQDVTTLKWSRCYRFNYLSHDQALSYITSWKLQSLLRLQLAKKLGITLR